MNLIIMSKKILIGVSNHLFGLVLLVVLAFTMGCRTSSQASSQLNIPDTIAIQEHLSKGGDPDKVNEIGITLLMLVAINGNLEAGKMLVENGANVNLQNRLIGTALKTAVASSHYDFVVYLLENGADANLIPKGNDSNLIIAAKNNNTSLSYLNS